MSPNNTFTTALDTCDYLPPNDLPYEPLSQVVRGGISIGDGSQGRNIKNWLVYYENNIIKVKPENGTVEFILIEPNVETLTLAFDSAMNVVLAWTISTGAFLCYYNSSTHTYIREDYIMSFDP